MNGAAPHAPDSSGPGARVPHAPDPPPVPGPHGAFTLHPASGSLEDFTAHEGVRAFVLAVVARQRPRNVLLYTGAPAQHAAVLEQLVSSGALIPVADRPNSFAAFSVPTDVARVEARTFIACAAAEDAGVLNNWREPGEMRACLHKTLDGASAGRTLFVVPFALGPLGGDGGAPGGAAPAPAAPAGAASASASASAVVGVQTTDSGYVVASLAIMTRAGAPALAALGARGRDAFFVRATHSLAAPLAAPGAADVPWPCAASAADVAIAHFPETREIVSTGSGYGGNAILAKKSFALRIASVLGRDDGWHAEHAFILGLQPPGGRRKRYIIGAFPSGCGKTNTAMLSLPPAYAAKGWTATTVGDDIAWLRWADDGRGGLQLRATSACPQRARPAGSSRRRPRASC